MVRTAAAHLRGPALDWWASTNANGGGPTTIGEVETELRRRFQPITSEEIARNRLHDLEQGRSSVNEYVAHFRRLVVSIPTMDAASQMHQFVRGLKHSVQTVLRQQSPATLDDAIALAVRVGFASQPAAHGGSSGAASAAMDISALDAGGADDDQLSMTRADLNAILAAVQNNSYGNGSGSNGRGAQGASGGYRGPRGPPVIKGMTEKQVQEYMKAGKCFGCGKTDHRSRHCPMRKVATDGTVSWSK